jgi:hypothetical protein
MKGNGACWICGGKDWDVFYVLTAPELGRVKFGITSGDPRPRLASHRRAGYGTIVRLLTKLPSDAAVEAERAAIAALAAADIQPVHGREWFGIEALPVVLAVVDNLNERIGQ